MQQPCSQGSYGKLTVGYKVGKFGNPPLFAMKSTGVKSKTTQWAESLPPPLLAPHGDGKWLCLPGSGGSSVYRQPVEIASSLFCRGQICALLKMKSRDLLTALNGKFKRPYYCYASYLAYDRQRNFWHRRKLLGLQFDFSFLPEVRTGSQVPTGMRVPRLPQGHRC